MTGSRTIFRCRTAFVLLMTLAAMGSVVRAETHAIDLFARGAGDRYWVCVVAKEDKPDARPVTSVRELVSPVAGTWAEIALIEAAALDAAPIGDRLAVLLADGDWKLLWNGGSTIGPRPPEGLHLKHLAGEGDTLWAVATDERSGGKAGPALLRWTESAGWSTLGPLPADTDMATASLAGYHGVPWLAWVQTDKVRVARFDGRAWVEAFRPVASGIAGGLVGGSPFPLLATLPDKGHLELWRPDAVPPKPYPLRIELPSAAVDATVVGPSLRIVSVKDGEIVQTAVDDIGRGRSYGPDVIARPTPPVQQSHPLLDVLMLAALTTALLATVRRRGEAPPALGPRVRLAPVGRRFLAAAIDLLPVLLTAWWVISHLDGSAAGLAKSPTRFYLPLFASVLVYLAHTMVGELWKRRSIGKAVCRLRVADPDGGVPSAERIVLRNLLRTVEITLPVVPVLFVMFTPLRQRVGDLAARTVVVADGKAETTTPVDDG